MSTERELTSDELDAVSGGAATEELLLPGFGIDVLSFEDPDGIQLELTAPVPADS